MSERVFVYGSLRAGSSHPMAARLASASVHLGRGRIPGRLYAIDWYPGADPDATADTEILGDVFLLENDATLALLDRYEGCGPGFPEPTEYVREQVVVTVGCAQLSCWIYRYQWPVVGKKRVESGDWLGHLAQHPHLQQQNPPWRGLEGEGII